MPEVKVTVIAPRPPPLTGQSAYYAYLRALLRGEPARFLPISARATALGLGGYLQKLTETVSVSWKIVTGPRSKRYLMVLDAGLGLWLNCLVIAAIRLRGARAVFSHHSFAYVGRRSLAMRLAQRLGGRDRVNLFLCARMRERFEAGYGATAWIVLSNARRVDDEIADDLAAGAADAFRLGYLSNISFEKGIREFVQLVNSLRAEGLPVSGVIAGPAARPAVAAFVETSVASSQGVLEWVGPLYGQDKHRFLASLALLVFPTRYANEAQPNVLFEAIRLGVPVIATARGCIADDLRGSGGLVAAADGDFVAVASDFIRPLVGAEGGARLAAARLAARGRFAELLASARASERELMELLLAD